MTRSRAAQTAFVAFGSNLGRRRSSVEKALLALSRVEGIRLRRVSPLYQTDPVGGPAGQRPYFNGVAELSVTGGGPAWLWRRLSAVESDLGRVRAVRWGPRVIDLDLLAFGRRRLSSRSLSLPHPRYHERRFVLAPFCDLAPGFKHPRLGAPNRTLLRRLPPGGQRVTMIGTWKESRYRLFSKRKPRANAS